MHQGTSQCRDFGKYSLTMDCHSQAVRESRASYVAFKSENVLGRHVI